MALDLETAELILRNAYDALDANGEEFGSANAFPSEDFEQTLVNELNRYNQRLGTQHTRQELLDVIRTQTDFGSLEEHAQAYYDQSIVPQNTLINSISTILTELQSAEIGMDDCIASLNRAVTTYNLESTNNLSLVDCLYLYEESDTLSEEDLGTLNEVLGHIERLQNEEREANKENDPNLHNTGGRSPSGGFSYV